LPTASRNNPLSNPTGPRRIACTKLKICTKMHRHRFVTPTVVTSKNAIILFHDFYFIRKVQLFSYHCILFSCLWETLRNFLSVFFLQCRCIISPRKLLSKYTHNCYLKNSLKANINENVRTSESSNWYN
jgi:hypothetical protein